MVYVLYLVYAVGTQPVAQHLGTFGDPDTCLKAQSAFSDPKAYPVSFKKEVRFIYLKCRPERKA